mgnify:CR=1 FL=1
MDDIDTRITNDRSILDLRRSGLKNVLALGHYNYKTAKERLETHVHSGIVEICYLEKGSQYYKVNHEDYLLRGGDLLITYPGEPHGTSGFPEEKGSLYWMLLKMPAGKDKILNLSPGDTKVLIERLSELRSRHFRVPSEVKNILRNIFKIYHKGNEPLKMEINNNILTFLLTVIHSGEQTCDSEISGDIALICDRIKDSLAEEFDLEQLASAINLSVSRFKHRFKEETGVPPKEFILREKIRKAKELMEADSISVKDIAYDLGFSSPSYFATVFKRFTRQTPSGYIASIVRRDQQKSSKS